MSGKPMGLMESTSISPSSMRYRLPTVTWGYFHIRTLQVISPLRTLSRRRLVNTIGKSYTGESGLGGPGQVRKATGLPISEALKRGLYTLQEQIGRQTARMP